MLDACIEFQLCIGWGEEELHENFEKDTLFYEATQKRQKNINIAGFCYKTDVCCGEILQYTELPCMDV